MKTPTDHARAKVPEASLGFWTGLGYTGAAAVFSVLLLLLTVAYRWTAVSRKLLF